MIDSDLFRSFQQYQKQQKLKHLSISPIQKIVLGFIFPMTLFFAICKIFYRLRVKSIKKYKIYIFPFTDTDPLLTIVEELSLLKESKIVSNPRALWVFPMVLFYDFYYSMKRNPLWTLKNMDFFGALALKVSQYYGYKVKYKIDNLLLFQEYSFYSSYLTKIFESENGCLYNIMHGIPGKEAAYFRFSKCFIWGDYFKNYYILNKAEENQFIVTGSIYHTKIKNRKSFNVNKYDIVYALQGEQYANINSTETILNVLQRVQKEFKLKIAVKQHPVYKYHLDIPEELELTGVSSSDVLINTKMLVSHFSTMLLDAKVLEKKVLAFVLQEEKEMVAYLDSREIIIDKKELYEKIVELFNAEEGMKLSQDIINFNLNSIEVIQDAVS